MNNTKPKPDGALGEHFVRTVRENWSKRCISDSTGKHLNYGQTLTSAVALSAELDRLTYAQDKVAVLLPPSVGAALTNFAITLLGKVAVNLNYTASQQIINSAVTQCNIKCIISSRSFVEKIENLKTLPGLVFLEDIVRRLKFTTKLKAYFKARFLPPKMLANARRHHADDLATIVFSSGSSGRPKGVMLSHNNIISNIKALTMVFHLKPDDNLCAVLPFFHSFGFTCSLWLPVISGVSAAYVANPLDGELVGNVARDNRSTILFAAPTFLLKYIRRTRPADFDNFWAVVTGAEKLKKNIADSFEAKFKIRPLEGYGTTELSPVVSFNLPDEQKSRPDEIVNKEGTVGRPVPGVMVKIVDVQTSGPVPTGQTGLLMVKGPNVMLGYLNNPEETARVIKDGWYNTGDIAKVDDDGFLIITDRLSRFSKIGGEMVPHLSIEQIFLNALDTHEQIVAVTSVPDHKRGEELVVLHLEKAGTAEKLHQIIAKSKLPNMWKPRRHNYFRIKSMPTLGSGKLDVMQLRKIAETVKNAVVTQ
ncbi:MAG: AMP-binding protein [Planctomycetota bacterium]|jgi:acyl-[acyl-carrier-protein]-phospholipid O-acyltransferase/long-chain-fatty-acid--[acyl-carrier-protein] ligase